MAYIYTLAGTWLLGNGALSSLHLLRVVAGYNLLSIPLYDENDVDDDVADAHFAYLPNRFVVVCFFSSSCSFIFRFATLICVYDVCLNTHSKGNQKRIIEGF